MLDAPQDLIAVQRMGLAAGGDVHPIFGAQWPYLVEVAERGHLPCVCATVYGQVVLVHKGRVASLHAGTTPGRPPAPPTAPAWSMSETLTAKAEIAAAAELVDRLVLGPLVASPAKRFDLLAEALREKVTDLVVGAAQRGKVLLTMRMRDDRILMVRGTNRIHAAHLAHRFFLPHDKQGMPK